MGSEVEKRLFDIPTDVEFPMELNHHLKSKLHSVLDQNWQLKRHVDYLEGEMADLKRASNKPGVTHNSKNILAHRIQPYEQTWPPRKRDPSPRVKPAAHYARVVANLLCDHTCTNPVSSPVIYADSFAKAVFDKTLHDDRHFKTYIDKQYGNKYVKRDIFLNLVTKPKPQSIDGIERVSQPLTHTKRYGSEISNRHCMLPIYTKSYMDKIRKGESPGCLDPKDWKERGHNERSISNRHHYQNQRGHDGKLSMVRDLRNSHELADKHITHGYTNEMERRAQNSANNRRHRSKNESRHRSKNDRGHRANGALNDEKRRAHGSANDEKRKAHGSANDKRRRGHGSENDTRRRDHGSGNDKGRRDRGSGNGRRRIRGDDEFNDKHMFHSSSSDYVNEKDKRQKSSKRKPGHLPISNKKPQRSPNGHSSKEKKSRSLPPMFSEHDRGNKANGHSKDKEHKAKGPKNDRRNKANDTTNDQEPKVKEGSKNNKRRRAHSYSNDGGQEDDALIIWPTSATREDRPHSLIVHHSGEFEQIKDDVELNKEPVLDSSAVNEKNMRQQNSKRKPGKSPLGIKKPTNRPEAHLTREKNRAKSTTTDKKRRGQSPDPLKRPSSAASDTYSHALIINTSTGQLVRGRGDDEFNDKSVHGSRSSHYASEKDIRQPKSKHKPSYLPLSIRKNRSSQKGQYSRAKPRSSQQGHYSTARGKPLNSQRGLYSGEKNESSFLPPILDFNEHGDQEVNQQVGDWHAMSKMFKAPLMRVSAIPLPDNLVAHFETMFPKYHWPRGTPVAVRYYPSGQPFCVAFQNGSGRVHYPHGGLAVVISAPAPNYSRALVIRDPFDQFYFFDKAILADINCNGTGTVYDESGVVKAKYNLHGGFYQEGVDKPSQRWQWNQGGQRLIIKLNRYMALKIMDQTKIYLVFYGNKRGLRLNLGAGRSVNLMSVACASRKGPEAINTQPVLPCTEFDFVRGRFTNQAVGLADETSRATKGHMPDQTLDDEQFYDDDFYPADETIIFDSNYNSCSSPRHCGDACEILDCYVDKCYQ